MPAERYFSPTSFSLHIDQELTGNEFHHLVRVMRARKGEKVELVNGKGTLAQATVHAIEKERAFLRINHLFQESPKPHQLILAQAIPKHNRLDFILEKGTELGVDAFWLFPGELSVKKEFFPHQIERAQSLLIAAMKQCGRLTLPTLHLQPPLAQWTTFPSSAFFGDLSTEALPFETVWKQSDDLISPFLFVTGPESGLTSQEEQFLKEGGVKGVKLHPYILRTDTASLMAISLLSHWLLTSSNP